MRPGHGGCIEHREVGELAVGGKPGDLDRPVAEVAVTLVGTVQVAVQDVRGLHGVHDLLEPLAVGVVAGQVGRCPPPPAR